MAIGILIKRVTRDGQDAKVLLPHIVELRALAVRQPGYISGETFFNLDRKDESLVISRWTALEHCSIQCTRLIEGLFYLT